jgi:hypothetical protein
LPSFFLLACWSMVVLLSATSFATIRSAIRCLEY